MDQAQIKEDILTDLKKKKFSLSRLDETIILITEQITSNKEKMNRIKEEMQKDIDSIEKVVCDFQKDLDNLKDMKENVVKEIEGLQILIEKWDLLEKYAEEKVMVPQDNEEALKMVLANPEICLEISLERQIELLKVCKSAKEAVQVIKASDKGGEILSIIEPELTAYLIGGTDNYMDLDLIELLSPETFTKILGQRDAEGKYEWLLVACELAGYDKTLELFKGIPFDALYEVFSENIEFRKFLATIDVCDLEKGMIPIEDITDEELEMIVSHLINANPEFSLKMILQIHKELCEELDWKERRVEDLLENIPSGSRWFKKLERIKDPEERKKRADYYRKRGYTAKDPWTEEGYAEFEIKYAKSTLDSIESFCDDIRKIATGDSDGYEEE